MRICLELYLDNNDPQGRDDCPQLAGDLGLHGERVPGRGGAHTLLRHQGYYQDPPQAAQVLLRVCRQCQEGIHADDRDWTGLEIHISLFPDKLYFRSLPRRVGRSAPLTCPVITETGQ